MLSYVSNYSKHSKTTKVHRFDVKTIKNVELRSNHSKHSKTTKVLKSRWIATIWRQNDQKCWVTFKPFQTQQNYKSDQITMNCIDLTSKRSKMLSYVPNHSKHSKTRKVIKLRNCIDELIKRFDQTVQTQQNYKKCIDLTSKR